MSKPIVAGIDLGTSNCALALSRERQAPVEDCPITQLVGRGQVGTLRGLASTLYLPQDGQFSPDMLRLPWQTAGLDKFAGHFARECGALDPERLVHSAKSWLCHPQADATRPILPWNSPQPHKVSPLEASRHYLEHILASLRHRHPELLLPDIQFVVTVPASFDEAARHLTVLATRQAGLGEEVILLEEPLAAFYHWLDTAGAHWRKQIAPGDLILICDVGGGTTDFSLLAVREEEGNLRLDRISVGQHILLGGDNMDLALAFALRGQLEESGKDLDDWQFQALIHAARQAKEYLFEHTGAEQAPITIPSRGSGLFAGTISHLLPRTLLDAVVLDGFFARTASHELPQEATSAGLQEFGLPYAGDPIIGKHLCHFLQQSLRNVRANAQLAAALAGREEVLSGSLLLPDAVLFNGGVFRAEPLRRRVREILETWKGGPVRELAGADYDLAVARGAARYGRNKLSGVGVRIRAGASRSYYLGIESSMPAIPGYKPPIKALCIVPQGMEEGTEVTLAEREFGLLTGATVRFRFYSANNRAGDQVGTLVPDAEKLLEPASRLEMTLPPLEGLPEKTTVPVKLHARLNELGVMELWMQHTLSAMRWKLNFSVRTE